jgi:hypothetical protein
MNAVWGKVLAACALLGMPSISLAATITFNTSDSPFTPGIPNQGYWSATQANSNQNMSYFVGRIAERSIGGQVVVEEDVTRDFFTFNLAGLVPGSVLSAQLEVTRLQYNSPNPSETLGLWGVTTSAAVLNNNSSANGSIFDDLGAGTSYGTFVVPQWGDTDAQQSVRQIFVLNTNAVNAINAAAGGFFSIGGALQGIDFGSDEDQGLFGFHGFFEDFERLGGTNQILRLEVESPTTVPEPSTMLLVAVGLTALFSLQRRQLLGKPNS